MDLNDDNEMSNDNINEEDKENSQQDWSEDEMQNNKNQESNRLEQDSIARIEAENEIDTVEKSTNSEQQMVDGNEQLNTNSDIDNAEVDQQLNEEVNIEQPQEPVETHDYNRGVHQMPVITETNETLTNNINDCVDQDDDKPKHTKLKVSQSQDFGIPSIALQRKTPKTLSKAHLKSVKKSYVDTRPAFSVTNNLLYPLKGVAYNPLTDHHLRGFFHNGSVTKQLKKNKLITKEGVIINRAEDWTRKNGYLDKIDKSKDVRFLNYDYHNMNIFSKYNEAPICNEPYVKNKKRSFGLQKQRIGSQVDLKQTLVTHDDHKRFIDEIRNNYLNE